MTKLARPMLALGLIALAPMAGADDGWIAGLGLDYEKTPYVGGKGNEVDLIPYIAYETGSLHIGIDEITTEVYDQNGLSLSAGVTPRWDPSFPDTALFQGLDRDATLEGVVSAQYSLGGFYGALSAQHDLMSVHDGFQAELALGTSFDQAGFEFDLSFGGTYRDKNLNRHLYGVGASETSAARGAYEPGGNWTPYAEMSVAYPITDSVAVFAYAELEKLPGSIKGSPLVDKDTTSEVGLYLLTRF